MKRGAAQEALIAGGYATRFATRCSRIVSDVAFPGTVLPLDESEITGEAVAKNGESGCHLSISEIFVRDEPVAARTHDYLAVVMIAFASGSSEASRSVRAFFAGPSTLRSHAVSTSVGVVITDVPIGTMPCDVGDVREISTLFYRINTGAQTHKALETVESLIPALDYSTDWLGSMAVAESILDRVTTLARSPSTSVVLRGTYSSLAAPASRAQPPYVAVLQASREGDHERTLFVRNGRLHAGPPVLLDQQRAARELRDQSATEATPVRFRDFALVRIGTPVHKAGPTRTIFQLRRERALATGGAVTGESENDDERSYLERDMRLRALRRLTAYFGNETVQRIPAVTPLAIEVGGDLIAAVESAPNTLNRECQDALDLMKDAIRYEFGIEVPGVRIRGNKDDLPGRTYLIMIREVPVVSGNIPADQALCNATVQELESIGIHADEAINPANGRVGGWVKKDDWDRARTQGKLIRKEGLHLWKDAEYLTLHLSAVIRKNATEFLTIKAVGDLIRARNKSAYPQIQAAPGGLPRFAAALRILVEEEVPVKDLRAICARYLELTKREATMPAIVEELRCLPEVRPALRRHRDHVSVYELGEKFVAMMHAGIVERGEVAILTIEPEPTQEALKAVRNEVSALDEDDSNAVLLVEDPRLRRPLRKLVELEFPHLPVLARRELVDIQGAVQTIGVIEVD